MIKIIYLEFNFHIFHIDYLKLLFNNIFISFRFICVQVDLLKFESVILNFMIYCAKVPAFNDANMHEGPVGSFSWHKGFESV